MRTLDSVSRSTGPPLLSGLADAPGAHTANAATAHASARLKFNTAFLSLGRSQSGPSPRRSWTAGDVPCPGFGRSGEPERPAFARARARLP